MTLHVVEHVLHFSVVGKTETEVLTLARNHVETYLGDDVDRRVDIHIDADWKLIGGGQWIADITAKVRDLQ